MSQLTNAADLAPAIRSLQRTQKRQRVQIVLLSLPLLIAFAIISQWLPSIRSKASANPLIPVSAHIDAVEGKTRELASQQVKLGNRLTSLPLRSLRDWEDPRLRTIGFLIDQEQEQQTFMLHSLRGLRDFGDIMKGIDEWSYFKYTQVRRLIERSRERQQRLRRLQEELMKEQQQTRKLIGQP